MHATSRSLFALESFALIAAVMLSAAIVSCGSGSSTNANVDTGLSSEEGTAATEDAIPINLLNGEMPTSSSLAKVVVKFKDGTDVRLETSSAKSGVFRSLAGNNITANIDRLITADTSLVLAIDRAISSTEDEVEQWLANWAARGVEMHDWNLYYHFTLPDRDAAEQFIEDIKDDPSVEYAEFLPDYFLTEVTTEDISDEQGYLGSSANGGLGIEEAWAKLDAKFPNKNIRGQRVMITDHEFDWNFDHEIVPIDETQEYISPDVFISEWLSYGTDQGRSVPSNVNHGTAVLGITVGQGELINKAIKGIAPLATPRVATMAANGMLGAGGGYAEDGTAQIGGIFLIEVQQKGITTVSSGCGVGDGTASSNGTGCVPIESHQYLHAEISDSGNAGMVIIAGAGNGSIDLNDPSKAAPLEGTDAYSGFATPANIEEKDSGSIIVGASLGADRRKAAWSNCGDRVDVFAWGAGVVTAGYGDRLNPDNATPLTAIGETGADNPRLYTSQFGGTSAAAAQIAGVAALVQSYMRQIVEEAGYVGSTVYLDSKEIRQILKESGSAYPAVYGQTDNDPNPNCNIGVQPNASIALDRVDAYLNAGNVLKIVPLNSTVVSGIRYDMDDDGKADLISFSRDHKWYVDLSNDGFGEWDLVLDASNVTGQQDMLFPVVADYNSDGRADLALYDSISGKWYIKYTTSLMIEQQGEQSIEWDRVIDYSTDSNWKAYSRPLVADFNLDKFVDISLATPDGYWVVDHNGFDGVKIENGNVEYLDKLGSFESSMSYLSTTQAAVAPDWAWIPNEMKGSGGLIFGAPDSVTITNNVSYKSQAWTYFAERNRQTIFNGGNNYYFMYSNGYIGVKDNTEGTISFFSLTGSIYGNTFEGLGDILCRPAPADYDGDTYDDIAVQCGNVWKIIYSTDASSQMVEYDLGDATDPLPGIVYAGGMKYQDVIDLFGAYRTELQCGSSSCTDQSTIYDVNPPVGPYFAECLRYWGANPSDCWDK